MEQLSIRAKHTQSRCHISPVANGMINNEDRGIILMGVQDNGLIDGRWFNAEQSTARTHCPEHHQYFRLISTKSATSLL
jgi:hypothetical protein